MEKKIRGKSKRKIKGRKGKEKEQLGKGKINAK
jgi:hypothetical protein